MSEAWLAEKLPESLDKFENYVLALSELISEYVSLCRQAEIQKFKARKVLVTITHE